MILFPYKPMEDTPFQQSKPPVNHTPKSDTHAVRIDDSMISLQTNNLAQYLLWFHWRIAGSGCVAPQDEGEPTSVCFLDVHYAMGDKTVQKTIENNVSSFEIVWPHRLNRDYVSMANGGMHACSRGSKTHSKANAQQIFAQETKTWRRGWSF